MKGSQPLFLAFWISQGGWDIRIDNPHTESGSRHIHIRRKRKRKGEYSWNRDGSRHDRQRFPVNEADINRTKEIAAQRLKIESSTLQFITDLGPRDWILIFDYCVITLDKPHRKPSAYVIVLASDEMLVFVEIQKRSKIKT